MLRKETERKPQKTKKGWGVFCVQHNLRGLRFLLSPSRKSEQRAQSHERKHHPDDHQVGHFEWGPLRAPLRGASGRHRPALDLAPDCFLLVLKEPHLFHLVPLEPLSWWEQHRNQGQRGEDP